MSSSAAVRLPQSAPEIAPKPISLKSALAAAREKISVDVLRFRTCCADPRASK